MVSAIHPISFSIKQLLLNIPNLLQKETTWNVPVCHHQDDDVESAQDIRWAIGGDQKTRDGFSLDSQYLQIITLGYVVEFLKIFLD